ncbi:MAG: hypothetical protein JW917_00770 [Ignavibacteria bacterium]|nr:hypothetical protein [Ignavibacteria bacterium]
MEKQILSAEEKLINAYCRHLERGFSENSFPGAEAKDVENLAKKLDEENQGKTNYVKLISVSKRKGMLFWEKIGLQGILGKKSKFNGSAWMFIMKNRFNRKDKHPDENKAEDNVVNVKLGFEDVQG